LHRTDGVTLLLLLLLLLLASTCMAAAGMYLHGCSILTASAYHEHLSRGQAVSSKVEWRHTASAAAAAGCWHLPAWLQCPDCLSIKWRSAYRWQRPCIANTVSIADQKKKVIADTTCHLL
jgi:hypothetical protein